MLSYKKLHKLVYVKYNIRIRLRQADMYKREEDPFDKLMELSLYDSQNSIQNWMEHARSNEDLLLDEEDT
jgi:chromatin remodeling complex protein RSC6